VRRRAALLAMVLAAGVAAPAAAPAARPACSKRVACKGKVHAKRAGLPLSWTRRPPPPPPPPPPDDPRYLQVVARDSDPVRWELQLSRGTLLSGAVEVEFNNRFAEDPHDLWLARGSKTYAFSTVQSGEAANRQLALTAGTWKLWCDIEGHEEQGMVAYVTVSDG
jgi:hypothetical protein